MFVTGLFIIVICMFFVVLGLVLIFKGDSSTVYPYLFSIGGILLSLLGVILVVKSDTYDEIKYFFYENKLRRKLKKVIGKYQPKSHVLNPFRKDLLRYYKNKETEIMYFATLCNEFGVPLTNQYYNAVYKKVPAVEIYDCYKSILNFEYGYENKIETLKSYAKKGNNDARVKLFLIYLIGVKDKNNKVYIEKDTKLAYKYLDLALKDNYVNAQEQLIWDAYYEKDYKKVKELIKKFGLEDSNINYTILTYQYCYGEGVDVDYKKTLQYASKANLTHLKLKIMAYCYKKLHKNDKALEIYKDLSELDIDEAKINYGELLTNEYGQHKKAFNIFKKGYKHHPENNEILFRLAYAYESGLGCKVNYQEAIRLYKILVDRNMPVAINNLAALYRRLELSNDKEIFDLYLKVMRLNEPRAFANVGVAYEYGKGVEKNINKAIEYYKKSVELDDPFGCTKLGLCYVLGKGVNKDLNKGLAIFHKGDYYEQCQYQIALTYFYDYKKYLEALKWFNKFEDTLDRKNIFEQYHDDYANACFCMGYCYSYNNQYDKAMKYYNKAASNGIANAMYNIGFMYENGHGVERNMETANYWYNKAKQHGYKSK